jgi:ketosteroid isomerase-like protein
MSHTERRSRDAVETFSSVAATTTSEPITGSDDRPDPTEPLGALTEFYRAFNTRDINLMERNWDVAGQIAMDNPVGGISRGWASIRAVYERIFGGDNRVTVEFHDYTLQHHGEVFLAVGRERGRLVRGDTVVDLAIRTSRIYRWTDGRWRQIHHHGSIDDPALLARYQQAVR